MYLYEYVWTNVHIHTSYILCTVAACPSTRTIHHPADVTHASPDARPRPMRVTASAHSHALCDLHSMAWYAAKSILKDNQSLSCDALSDLRPV